MFARHLRVSAVLVVMLLIGTTLTTADEFLPPVESAPAPLLGGSGTKPAAVEDPRVFSSGPVVEPKAPDPMLIPGVERAPVPPPDAVPVVPDKSVLVPTPDPPAVYSPIAVAPTVAAPMMAPTLEQYYEPYATSGQLMTQSTPPMAKRWVSLETLLWWSSDVSLPVLVTTSPIGTSSEQAGILGGNTQSLFGGNHILNDPQGGFRLKFGNWQDGADGGGFTGEFMMLGSVGHDFRASSIGDLILARPFTNFGSDMGPNGTADSQLIAYPGQYRGSINVNAETRMYGLAAHVWGELVDECDCSCCGENVGCSSDCGCNSCSQDQTTRLGVKLGPRFYHLADTFLVDERVTRILSGTTLRLTDLIQTENSFLGGELGIRAQRKRGRFDFELGLQLAIGATRQELDTAGTNTFTPVGGIATTSAGGFLVQESNAGSRDRTKFSLVPGLDFSIGREFNNGWRGTVGYSLMYWTNVVRAVEQIDPSINEDFFAPALTPSTGSNRPGPMFRDTNYLAHGLTFGLEKSW